MATTEHITHDLFVSLDDQVRNVRHWNDERGWGIAEEDLERASLESKALGPTNGLTVHVLVPYLAPEKRETGEQRTLEELWEITASLQPETDRSLETSKQHLWLLSDHQPGLRWETIDLAFGRGCSPNNLRDRHPATAGVMAAAAHFPNWVRAMDGDRVPFVAMGGYCAYVCGDEARIYAPAFSRSFSKRSLTDDVIWLSVVDRATKHGDTAVPLIIER